MGIPTLARKIMSEYPSTHYFSKSEKFTDLYFDYNSLIYQVHAKLQHNNKINKNYNDYLIKQVIEYTLYLIDLVNPKREVYIAFDGTVPKAKIITQRARRYKNLILNKYKKEELHLQLNEDFHTDAITPGTLFINKLSQQLKEKLQEYKLKNNKLKIILSDSSVVGEGEHKFFKYLKQKPLIKGENICIYGQDADLIMLSLTTNHTITLLRPIQSPPSAIEKEKYEKDEGLYYLNPNLYVEKVFETINLISINSNNLTKKNNNIVKLLDDYIFYTFLLGNDFIPRLRILKLKEGQKDGLSKLINIYKEILNETKTHLINGVKINTNFLKKMFNKLAINEHDELLNQQKELQTRLNKEQEKQLSNNKNDIQHALEQFEHGLFINPNHPLYEQYREQFDKLNYFSTEWRSQYYKVFFNFDVKKYPEYLDNIIRAYLKTLKFTLIYYLDNSPPDWDWCFSYHVAPLTQDISNFLEVNKKYDINEEKFNTKTVAYSPYEQMMMNLPPERARIYLSPFYIKLMTDINSPLLPGYPTEFVLDVLQGEKFIYAEPKLPEINNVLLKELIKNSNNKNNKQGLNKINKNVIII